MANNKRIKGITIEIGGDVKGLDKALKGVNETINDTQAQLKDVQRLLKLDPKNTELLRQKQKLLARQVGETKDRLEVLKRAEQQLKDSGVDENSAQFQALRREIAETENSLDDLRRAAGESNVALSRIGATADSIAEGADKVADATRGMSKAAAAGLGVVAATAGKIVDAYADYEQLVGGVETLFGEDVGAEIKRAAADAYKTAGLSANEYMETVTGFSASLISSLGGDTRKAASYADMAITDMADNANKMGTDIASIQHAYQGFAKQTYTMLDNLKLGYGGTQDEMKRLLANAEAISGIEYDISSFSDIIDAIHTIQKDMGIMGATADEAANTVSGSVAAFKGSVSNLVAGMGDADADIDQLVGNVVDAFKTMAGNILPVLQNIWDHLPGGAKFAIGAMGVMAAISPIASGISSVAGAVSKLMPLLSKLGPVFAKIGPVAKAAMGGIGSAVTGVAAGIGSAVTGVAAGIGSAVTGILSFFVANPILAIVAALVAAIAIFGDDMQAALQELDDWLQGVFAKDWTEIFGPVLGGILTGFFSTAKTIWDSIKLLFDGIIDFIRGVFTGDWERAWNGVKEIFRSVLTALIGIAKVPINAIISLFNGLIRAMNAVIDALNSIHFTIPDWVPLLGGKSFGLNLRHLNTIPYMAKGGILSRGSAIVGEAGPELLTVAGGRTIVQPLGSGGGAVTNHNLGGVSVVVYGAPGQDVNALAEIIMDRMQTEVDRREAAFA